MTRLRNAARQLLYLAHELRILVGRRPYRWLTIWLGTSAGVIASYRLERCLYLLFGEAYALPRVFVFR